MNQMKIDANQTVITVENLLSVFLYNKTHTKLYPYNSYKPKA